MNIEQQNIEYIRKRLTRLMLASIIITLILFGTVIGAIIYKLRHETHPNILLSQTIMLEKNSQILSQNLNGTNLSILVQNQLQKYILIYDYKKAEVITKINLNL